ncbi:hypothetical protein BCAH1134_C0610 (plasmid) [Bacillus cereus AH1134]|nr:hypothetical protein BCAH1134_C0610 [Bacillus cereus AH1134]
MERILELLQFMIMILFQNYTTIKNIYTISCATFLYKS